MREKKREYAIPEGRTVQFPIGLSPLNTGVRASGSKHLAASVCLHMDVYHLHLRIVRRIYLYQSTTRKKRGYLVK